MTVSNGAVKIGVAPHFYCRFPVAERLLAATKFMETHEQVNFGEDICLLNLPEWLRKKWWLTSADEFIENNTYCPNFENFIADFTEFAYFKKLPLSLDFAFDIVVSDPNKEVFIDSSANIAGILNLGDKQLSIAILDEPIFFDISEGAWLPENCDVRLLPALNTTEIRVLFIIKRTKIGTLKPGIRVLNLTKDEQRLSITTGVLLASQVKTNVKYVSSAYVPNMPFRDISAEIAAKIIMPSYEKLAPHPVVITTFPKELVEPFFQLGLCDAASEQEVISIINSSKGKQSILAVKDYCAKYGDDSYKIETKLVYNPSNLLTATKHLTSGNLVGLHIDYVNNQSLFIKKVISNRISINLGSRDRYFTFINIPLNELVMLMNAQRNDGVDQLIHNFLQKYPSYPVIRLRVKPGEAYIAPTRNIIHDGVGPQDAPDIHLTFCGFFDLGSIDEQMRDV